MPRILHLLDPTTPTDSFDILGHLMARAPQNHIVAALGHRSSGLLAAGAGIALRQIAWLPSMGWADPTGWRALRLLVKQTNPTHLHAWGVPAAVAIAMSKFPGPRMATFADLPRPMHIKILRRIDRRFKFTWIAASYTLCDHLIAGGVAPERVTCIAPGIASVSSDPFSALNQAMLRKQLGIGAADGTVLLLGGEGRAARYDHGIWTGAIVQQILPKTRIIVRQNPRGGPTPGLERFFNRLPDDNLITIAPREFTWRTLMPAADILLVAAEDTIPAGSVLEAMAAGVPVIATPIDAMKELIEHGRNGILAATLKPRALAAQLQEFLSMPDLAASLTPNALTDIHTRFTIDAMVRAYDAVET